MIPGPGPIEVLIVAIIGIWKIGLPLAALYFLFRMWRRLQQIEYQLQELRAQQNLSRGQE